MRLWELEGGDGEEAGIAYAGIQQEEVGQDFEIIEAIDERPDDDERDDAGLVAEPHVPEQRQVEAHDQQRAPQANNRAAVAREGPLVLRIEGGPPPAPNREAARRAPAPAPAPAPAVGRGGAQGANEGGRGAGRRGRGARRGRGPGGNRQNNHNNGVPDQPRLRRRWEFEEPLQGQGIGDLLRQEGELDPQQAAWIRQFVQLALVDQEHLVDDDDDDEL